MSETTGADSPVGLDLDAIEARAIVALDGDSYARVTALRVAVNDLNALVAEVRRLQAVEQQWHRRASMRAISARAVGNFKAERYALDDLALLERFAAGGVS